ncbi:YjiH family protein [uncultured Psychrobacter sp.]|uniref:YjiH family protein n=1 Tax=uncultured Psychrobacter sp. TaxID=259303 RepID=UPI0034590C46
MEDNHSNFVSSLSMFRFFLYSLLGIFIFFVPIKIGDVTSIPLDHMATWLSSNFESAVTIAILLLIVAGSIYPFIDKSWNKSNFHIIFTLLKIVGAFFAFLVYFELGPEWFLNPHIAPYVFDYLVTPVGVMVPLGGAFLGLLTGYGLLEFMGIIAKPIMRPVWNTPGRAAVNALASFVASFAVGLLITNREYREKKFTKRQAAIVATGFSTVTVAFMIVVAKTLDLMSSWNLYFWTTLFVTFLVTAITARIYPLRNMAEEYIDGTPIRSDDDKDKGYNLRHAFNEGMIAAGKADNIFKNIWINTKDGILMTMSILPTILSIGIVALMFAEYTLLFDFLAYIFYPFTYLLQLPDPMLAAKAAALGITEMFLPPLLVADADIITKFVIAVVCVSSIIFFSASVPSILSTDIPIKVRDLVIIWFERTLLSLIIVTPIAFMLF